MKSQAYIRQDKYQELLSYVENNYIRRNMLYVQGFERTSDTIHFKLNDHRGSPIVDVLLRASERPEIAVSPLGLNLDPQFLQKIAFDIEYNIIEFAEITGRGRLFLTFVPGLSVLPSRLINRKGKILERIFFSNIYTLFALSIIISFAIFIAVGPVYGPIALVAVQVLFVLLSREIISRLGDWTLTSKNGTVYIVEHNIPPNEIQQFMQAHGSSIIEVKQNIYTNSLDKGSEISPEVVVDAWRGLGVFMDSSSIKVRKVEVYKKIEEVAKLYNLSVPKVVLANIIKPNAAASGPAPRRSVVMITTGALSLLNEEEIGAVLGHEFSHIKNRDMITLFVLVMAEYITRLWIFGFIFNSPGILPGYLFFPYILISLTALYFIAKFFEARADLDSAIVVGNPTALGNALRRIGLRRLFTETTYHKYAQNWLTWDPHPPISFRVRRLEDLAEKPPTRGENTLLASAHDCLSGFAAALRGRPI